MCAIQIICQPCANLTVRKTQTTGERLGGTVQIIDIVIDEMEEIAHFIIGAGLCSPRATTEALIQRRQLLAVALVGLMANDKRMGQAWGILRD